MTAPRCKTKHYYSGQDFGPYVPQIRQSDMLAWLKNQNADSAVILDWFMDRSNDECNLLCDSRMQERPHSAALERYQGLYEAAIQSVPSAQAQQIDNVFIGRIAEALEWLADNEQERQQWGVGAWAEFVEFLRRVKDPILHAPIKKLLDISAQEEVGAKLFNEYRSLREDFVECVIQSQPDDSMRNYWLGQLKQYAEKGYEYYNEPSTDRYKVGIHAVIRGILSCPGVIQQKVMDEVALSCCQYCNKTFPETEETAKRIKFMETIKSRIKEHYPRHFPKFENAIKRLGKKDNDYDFLQTPERARGWWGR